MGEGRELFWYLLLLHCPQLKIIFMPKIIFFEWHISYLLITNLFISFQLLKSFIGWPHSSQNEVKMAWSDTQDPSWSDFLLLSGFLSIEFLPLPILHYSPGKTKLLAIHWVHHILSSHYPCYSFRLDWNYRPPSPLHRRNPFFKVCLGLL